MVGQGIFGIREALPHPLSSFLNKARKIFFSAFILTVFPPDVSAVFSSRYFDSSRNPASACAVIFSGDNGDTRLCTGDIVARDKILTAAHCVLLPKAETVTVHCQGQREMMVKGYSVYPLFRLPSGKLQPTPYDHALLQTESDFDLANMTNLRKVRLPKSGREAEDLLEKGDCAIFGYGVNSKGKSSSLLGGSVKPEFSSSFDFPLAVFEGPSMPGVGDSGGGLFCLPSGKTHPDNRTRIATVSQTVYFLTGKTVGVAALFSDSILEWIERAIDKDLPLVPGFSPTVELQTKDLKDMESSEQCVTRLVANASANCISNAMIDMAVDEIIYQCGGSRSPEHLRSLLETGQKVVGCLSRPAPDSQTVISRGGNGISYDNNRRTPVSDVNSSPDFRILV